MPDGDEAVNEVQTEAETQINLLDPTFREEVEVKLTRGQSIFVYRILEANIRPQGFEMIEFSMDLLNRFRSVVEDTPTVTEEPIVATSFASEKTEKVAGTGTSFDMSPKNPLGE